VYKGVRYLTGGSGTVRTDYRRGWPQRRSLPVNMDEVYGNFDFFDFRFCLNALVTLSIYGPPHRTFDVAKN
jgi:hypothetical protein